MISVTQPQTERDFLSRPVLSAFTLNWETSLYILFIALAAVTHFWDLGSRVVSHDESLHTQYSFQFYNGDGYHHTPLMHGPSLFHATALSFWLFGDNDYASRIPVALLGVLLVFMPYLLRDWIGRKGALFASFMILISPYMTYYSRYIRHDIYVITFAFITFIAMQYYLRERKDKYLWWFAIGLGLMFTTMETSFIYVAIFGSFLVLRLAILLWQSDWFRPILPQLKQSAFLIGLALLLIGGGLAGQRLVPGMLNQQDATTTPTDDVFAIDPEAAETAVATAPSERNELIMRWLQIAGIGLLSAALFMAANQMRPYIDQFAEFDLIILFTTLVLPAASPLLITIAGWNPLDYSLHQCPPGGLANLGECAGLLLTSGIVRSGIFVILTLAAGAMVGLWWHTRRWLIAAAIFHVIFAVLFTSVFTNPGGWGSGMIGSLGYWLEQHDVQRGGQPLHYYLVVTTLYEFLPIIFSLAACRLWLRRHNLNKIVGYWLTTFLTALLAFSLTRWLFNLRSEMPGIEPDNLPGLIAAGFIVVAALFFWFIHYQRQLKEEYGLKRSWQGLVDGNALVGFIPYVAWWMFLSWIAYSIAGEKMPWLSTHFIIPMVLLGGWYFNEKLQLVKANELLSWRMATLVGLTAVFIVAVFIALSPILLGHVRFGGQQLDNLTGLGRFLGGLVIAGALLYALWDTGRPINAVARRVAWTVGLFVVLALLTIRFTYMATFPNADYVTEYMVYAHGAPATKSMVMNQVEELSMRIHGDKSIRVAYDNDSSWPLTWYLRNYPNRLYYGETPTPNITEAAVVIVGSRNWSKVEPFVIDDYEEHTHTFLWWPMERYRDISWNAVLGDPNMPPEERRGLGNPDVRQALWNIFFYRDYTKYGQVFGGNYNIGQWPLRHELRMYIRKDVAAQFWDYGVGAVAIETPADPYAENVFELSPVMVIGDNITGGAASNELFWPRNIAIGLDGRLYVADSGNHRIQVFDAGGRFLYGWGAFGPDPGQFNEPWGLALDDNYVYVADTWNHRVQKFTLDGQFVAVFGRSGSPAAGEVGGGLFFGPRDIVVLPDNQLLVTDTGNHRLQIMDNNGNFVTQVGSWGNQLGQFNEPVGLASGPDGYVYLADTWNARVQRFTPDLLPIGQWPVRAWRGDSVNNKPYLAVDSGSRVYVTDPEAYRVLIFDGQGNFLGRFGRFGPDLNSLGLPNGITVDQDGYIYVADTGNHRILKYAPIFGLEPSLPGDLPMDENSEEGNGASGGDETFTDEAEEAEPESEGDPTETIEESGEDDQDIPEP